MVSSGSCTRIGSVDWRDDLVGGLTGQWLVYNIHRRDTIDIIIRLGMFELSLRYSWWLELNPSLFNRLQSQWRHSYDVVLRTSYLNRGVFSFTYNESRSSVTCGPWLRGTDPCILAKVTTTGVLQERSLDRSADGGYKGQTPTPMGSPLSSRVAIVYRVAFGVGFHFPRLPREGEVRPGRCGTPSEPSVDDRGDGQSLLLVGYNCILACLTSWFHRRLRMLIISLLAKQSSMGLYRYHGHLLAHSPFEVSR